MKNAIKLNCGFYLQASYKKDVNPCSHSKSADKLATKLKKLMAIRKRTPNIYKSFKNNITIKMQNLKAMPQARKFG